MSKRDKQNQNFSAATEDYLSINSVMCKVCDLSSQLNISASKIASVKVPSRVDETIPGSPGTLLDLATALYSACSKLQSSFHVIYNDIANNEMRKLKGIIAQREADKAIVDETLKTSESFDKHLMTRTMTQHKNVMDSVAKMNEFVEKNPNVRNNMAGAAKTKLPSLWQAYQQNLGQFMSDRQCLKISATDLEQKMSSHLSYLDSCEQDRRKELNDVMQGILNKANIIPTVDAIREELVQASNWVDFRKDFIRNADTHKIAFFDMPKPKFERFKFSNQFTQPDRFYIPRFRLDFFPIAAAVAIKDFEPESQNELRLVKGKRVYLMETQTQDWVLVMSPSWCQIGYVPLSHIKPVGKFVAYVKQDLIKYSPKLQFSQMRIVAVLDIEETPKKTYVCEDENGFHFKIPDDEGILYLL